MRHACDILRKSAGVQVAMALALNLSLGNLTPVSAANGDCGQPISSGAGPVATDCLFILQSAVGAQICDPACVCDLNASGGNPNATDALSCLNASVGGSGLLNCQCVPASTDGDDFDDNSRDATKWDVDIATGNGVLTETSERLEYRCSSATSYDEQYWVWVKSEVPYDANWEMQIDLVNLTTPPGTDQGSSFGLELGNSNDVNDYIFAELYAVTFEAPPARNGFYGAIGLDGGSDDTVDTGEIEVTEGALRFAFDASTKVVTLYYDVDPGDGYQWISYGSFGIAGSGGTDGNDNWGLSSGALLPFAVYGFSSNTQIGSGMVYGDNFSVTGALMQ